MDLFTSYGQKFLPNGSLRGSLLVSLVSDTCIEIGICDLCGSLGPLRIGRIIFSIHRQHAMHAIVGLMLDQRGRRWTITKLTLGKQRLLREYS